MAELSPKLIYSAIFIFAVALTVKDFYQTNEPETTVKEIPDTKFKQTFIGPTLKFLYWPNQFALISVGYRRVFEQYASILQEKYPDITVLGDTYPPPMLYLRLAQFLGVAKLVLIAVILANLNPFPSMGLPTPAIFQWLLSNRMYGCLMTFFTLNMLEGQLVSTGAFEIIFNDVPVWSKLQTGRIPSPPELFQILDNHMMLRSSSF
ncbi:SELENOT [Cordylochernes scorpioides]|uniref:SELENOT n=1 Tax=Cordylochernes scorpioides TaxID=51811 RepID=A0ABY6LPM2_9ARAC|nr:SELENOT [Cordylochernes scorpioides]